MCICIQFNKLAIFKFLLTTLLTFSCQATQVDEGLPLYYWKPQHFINFGDYLSPMLVERIVQVPIQTCGVKANKKKLLAIGSILHNALNGDVIWGSGVNGKDLAPHLYRFKDVDVRAVRGPLTRQFLMERFQIKVPEIYGDPALLIPYFFPEFQKEECPAYDYVIIPHYSEKKLFPKEIFGDRIIDPTEPWNVVIKKILNSRFVISSSLHGLIIAEAYGIPARLLKVTDNEPLFKYQDYYFGTHRLHFQFATSIEEALEMGGEPPVICDLESLYQAFPFEFWSNTFFKLQLLKSKT